MSSNQTTSSPSRGAISGRLLAAMGISTGVIVAVATLVAGIDRPDDTSIGESAAVVRTVADAAMALVVVLSAAMLVAVAVSQVRRPEGERSQVPPGQRLGVALATLVCLGAVWLLSNANDPSPEPEAQLVPPVASVDPPTAPPSRSEESSNTGFYLGAVAGVVLLAAAALLFRRPHRAPVETEADDQINQTRRTLEGLLDDAIAQLRSDPDPRRSVISAWARLELALEAVGLPRQPAETPERFLARILTVVEASAPAVARLTAVFQQARFSTHFVGPQHQQEAVDALVAVRDELRLETASW